jgi:hypothetical protein
MPGNAALPTRNARTRTGTRRDPCCFIGMETIPFEAIQRHGDGKDGFSVNTKFRLPLILYW